MEKNVGDEMKSVVSEVKNWLTVEVEYLKLTAAEKLSVLVSSLILVIVLFIVGMVVLIVFAFALVDLFNLFMPHSLACVTVGGILLLLIALLYLLRNPLVVNPITKLITKLFLTPKKK
ncbi:MAG: phage holin family protein [Muribaculaceae bacterium]|nr:phage holin family protein [Muribaculaceae bacterium]